MYRCTGSIFIEGTYESANYDFEMEWEGDSEPNEMDVLGYLLNSGILQIMHEETEYLGNDEEDE